MLALIRKKVKTEFIIKHKLLSIIVFLMTFTAHAELDQVHYLPPLTLGNTSNANLTDQQLSKSTPSNVSLAGTLLSEYYYIDAGLEAPEEIKQALQGKTKENAFHLFSHGRPGELYIGGKWLAVNEIVQWWKEHDHTEIAELNIYGCHFAAGEKGVEAIAYLEQELGLSISASDNITGLGGDWVLEYNSSHERTTVVIEDYSYNLQTPPGGITNGLEIWYDAGDTDGDGDYTNNPATGTEITTWVDKSGNGNDAVVNTPTNTGAYLVSNAAELINGLPVLRFIRTGSLAGSVYETGVDIRSGTMEDVTIFTVYKPKTSTAQQGLWGCLLYTSPSPRDA